MDWEEYSVDFIKWIIPLIKKGTGPLLKGAASTLGTERITTATNLLENDQYKILDVKFFSEETIQVFYSHNKDQFDEGVETNVAIASFVTAQSRLHLYKELRICLRQNSKQLFQS